MSVSLSPAGVDEVEDEADFLSFTNGAWAGLREALPGPVAELLEPGQTVAAADVPPILEALAQVENQGEVAGPVASFLRRMVDTGRDTEVN